MGILNKKRMSVWTDWSTGSLPLCAMKWPCLIIHHSPSSTEDDKFLMILPKQASGKEADKQPLSRASRKETPRWGLFPSDLSLGSQGCLSCEKGKFSQTLNVWLLCQRPWRTQMNRLQNNTLLMKLWQGQWLLGIVSDWKKHIQSNIKFKATQWHAPILTKPNLRNHSMHMEHRPCQAGILCGEDRFTPSADPRSYPRLPWLPPILNLLLYYFFVFRWRLSDSATHLTHWGVVVPWGGYVRTVPEITLG